MLGAGYRVRVEGVTIPMERLRTAVSWTKTHWSDIFLLGSLAAAGILNYVMWARF